MNMPTMMQLRRTIITFISGLALCLALTNVAVAQSANSSKAPPPPDASAAPQRPAPVYPDAWWPYAPAAYGSGSLPTMDLYGASYLPYLPWLGTNIALLVNYADFFYQLEKKNVTGSTPYKAPITALANNTLVDAKDETQKQANKLTETDIKNALSNSQDTTVQVFNLVSIPGTDTVLPCKNDIDCKINPPPTNKQFNADTLLGTDGYKKEDNQTIDQLITFLSSMTEPLPSLALSSDPEERKNQLLNADIQRYILLIRTLAASQSMALGNFNYLAKEREIIPDLGAKAGMTTLPTDGNEQPINDASQLQLEQFLINRRLGNPEWYTAVNNAPDIAVQREMLYVLAEMQQQLYQLRMVNERLLATMSVMQMQMTQFNKSNIMVQQQNLSENLSETGGTSVNDMNSKGSQIANDQTNTEE